MLKIIRVPRSRTEQLVNILEILNALSMLKEKPTTLNTFVFHDLLIFYDSLYTTEYLINSPITKIITLSAVHLFVHIK